MAEWNDWVSAKQWNSTSAIGKLVMTRWLHTVILKLEERLSKRFDPLIILADVFVELVN